MPRTMAATPPRTTYQDAYHGGSVTTAITCPSPTWVLSCEVLVMAAAAKLIAKTPPTTSSVPRMRRTRFTAAVYVATRRRQQAAPSIPLRPHCNSATLPQPAPRCIVGVAQSPKRGPHHRGTRRYPASAVEIPGAQVGPLLGILFHREYVGGVHRRSCGVSAGRQWQGPRLGLR